MRDQENLGYRWLGYFLVLAPGFVAGMVAWWISHWRVDAAFLGFPVFRFVGGVLLGLGAVGLLDSFGRFAVGESARRLRCFRRGIWLALDFIVMSEIRCTCDGCERLYGDGTGRPKSSQLPICASAKLSMYPVEMRQNGLPSL